MSKIDISKLNKEQLKALGKSIDEYEIPQEVYDEALEQEVDDFIDHFGLTQKEVSREIESRMSQQGSDDYNKLKKLYKRMVDTREEMNANRKELKEAYPKELEKLEETQNKIEADFRTNLLYFNPSNDEEQIFVDMVMLKIMRDSDGKVDDYGIPKSVMDTDEKEIEGLIKVEVDKKLDEIFKDKIVLQEMKDKNISQEQIDEFRKQLQEVGIGALTKIMLQEIGSKFQNPIRKLGSLFTGAIKRSTKFKSKGSSDKTKERNAKIRTQADKLIALGRYKVTHIIEKIAKEHKLSNTYVRDIIYKDTTK